MANLSHKARLTVGAAAVTGVMLALLFGVVFLVAQRGVTGEQETELRGAMGSLAADPKSLEIEDFRESHPNASFAVFDEQGALVAHQGALHLPPGQGFATIGTTYAYGIRHGSSNVVVGIDGRESIRGQQRLAWILCLLWLPLTCFFGIVAWIAAKSVFEPLERLTEQATRISGANLHERLSTDDPAEFGSFAQQLNQMLGRIEETLQREDQFASDAAHELRTPLAILRTQIETTLLNRRSTKEYVAAYGSMLVEVDRLTRIVEALLRTARRVPLEVDPIDIEPVVIASASRWQDPYTAAGVFIEEETCPAVSRVGVEEMTVIVDNLLENALRFSPKGSTVRLRLGHVEGWIDLKITDEGPGIPPELAQRVFDRFVRSDHDRNRDSGGAGIGLAVCKKIVTSRGGDIFILPGEEPGATVVCRLPSWPTEPPRA
ncbi:MAG: HAMP domain-containing sensor histidine kinase [Fimbriimonas sp.]|nr:HAMP domain-containing sensor histidine kinase [Fimbriimonas sp.]